LLYTVREVFELGLMVLPQFQRMQQHHDTGSTLLRT
jgi:hypothetical protein